MMTHLGIWAFTNADNDLVLFSRSYDHEPTEAEVQHDGFLWYHEEEPDGFDRETFEVWHDSLCQPGLVSIVRTQ